uniref:Uncharacterized protein n=1 Tax=Avena sativa TaxID=4498 RepID=A0ACD5Y630_AVESA
MVIDNDSLLAPQPGLKDLCMSFALFKLLRRRFAKCHLAELGSKKAFKFVLDVLLNNGSPDRVFKVLADEVSFVRDSYYSSLPTSCFGRLLPILNIIVSLSIIIWCLLAGEIIVHYFKHSNHPHQIFCSPKTCMLPQYLKTHDNRLFLGNVLYNSLPTYSLLVAVILAEAWEIVAYLCSNWLKVTLVCSYVTHGSWQQSPRIQGLFGYVLKLRINSRKGMIDPMGQISLLAHPRPKICGCFCFSNSRVHLVKVPLEVKASIISMLKSNNGSLSKGTMSLRNSRIGSDILWACEGQGTSDVMLVWHVATGIFEARHAASASCSADKMTTRHLYRYCVYLMKAAPELLPDDKAWSKKLYKTVKKDIKHALTGGRRGKESVEHQNLIAMLNDRSEHDVVKRGVRLGKQLVDLVSNEDVGWGILARFWSEMILYIAPSDNLKAQKKAIASGTELLTLIWVLLNHAGVITRPDDISDAF